MIPSNYPNILLVITQKFILTSLIVALFCSFSTGQELPFHKGINLTNWFQSPSARTIQFTKYTKKDFENIKSLGCDVIRLPINLHYMTNGAPDYTLDPLFLQFLDEAVTWAEEIDIALILDNHTFDPSEATSPEVGDILNKVWVQMAEHYESRFDKLYYEVLNEPHGIDADLWNSIQGEVIKTIRQYDTRHTIIVGPANFNSFHLLADLPIYEDDNLIYTFHFYDPFIFTHQGASWVEPSMVELASVPFPYNANAMPGVPDVLKGSWIESAYNRYDEDGTLAKVHELIDIAADFQVQNDVTLFCGEFGVLMDNSNQEDRVYWYEEVRKYLEEKSIPWTMWDYHHGFGIFENGSNGMFDHNLNEPLLQSLGFEVPAQTQYIQKPDSVGMPYYTDFVEQHINSQVFNNDGTVDFYSAEMPNNDMYCLDWYGANQYQSITLDFVPNRDFSELLAENYVLDFFVRSTESAVPIDIRFIDTKTGDDDRPWRMRYTLTQEMMGNDRYWHHLRVPLAQFAEQGSWDDGEWFNPEGKFDWSAIDKFELVSEHDDFDDARIWIDNLVLTNTDTAQILETGQWQEAITSIAGNNWNNNFVLYPNPTADVFYINASGKENYDCQIINLQGQVAFQQTISNQQPIDISDLPSGYYTVLFWSQNSERLIRKRIVKL